MSCAKFVDEALKKAFYKLGFQIGKTPGYFIIVPLLLALLCISGFQRMDYEYDPEYLFSPVDGFAKEERSIMETYFPVNYTSFSSARMARVGKFGRVVVDAKDGGSMLRTNIWNQLLYLDQIIYNVSVMHEDSKFSYEDLCAKWQGYCYDNEVLRLSDLIPSIESGQINLTYPIYFDPYTFETYTLPAFFGGVQLTDLNTITEVKAVAFAYFLDITEEWRDQVGFEWEAQFLKDVEELSKVYCPDLRIGRFTSNTPAWEMERSRLSVTANLCINVSLMVVFSFVAAYMSDVVRAKSLVGFAGLLSSAIATIAAFGFCCYIGVEFVALNMAAPFLLLGIGVDDTFVMLSSWYRSPRHASVPERMGRCMSEAAVSITVTSVTDFLSFMAGVFTPFPCVRIFCTYTGVAVAFIYIWHITLFSALLAISGFAERRNLHGLCCIPTAPKSISVNRPLLFRLFMTGGVNPEDPHNPKDNRDHAGMVWFRDHLGTWLSKWWVKTLVLLVFCGYIGVAGWGVTQIKEGLDKKNTANYDSYVVEYYKMEDEYFKEYAYTISVMFTGTDLDFSNENVTGKIDEIMQALENSTYIDGKLTQSWLRDFLDYVDRNQGYDDIDVSISTESEFASTLKNYYLTPSNPNNLDVVFDKSGLVKGARFLIHGLDIRDSMMEKNMVSELREICNKFSTDSMNVTVFHPFFIYIDQYLAIVPQTIQCIGVTAVVMVIISLILIPSLVCSLWISFSIISIEIGVVGFMTLWGVSVDGVALINLVMCIGFSVDFSAHICYHYITEVNKRPEDRIRGSLYALGIPILQGAGSTILGVLGLAFAPSYLFVTFFKMIFLVIVLGMLHGIVLLPILLSLLGPGSCGGGNSVHNSDKNNSDFADDSGVSTPTTFSIRQMQKMSSPGDASASGKDQPLSACYTVNLGFISDANGGQITTTTATSSSSAVSRSSDSSPREVSKSKSNTNTNQSSGSRCTHHHRHHKSRERGQNSNCRGKCKSRQEKGRTEMMNNGPTERDIVMTARDLSQQRLAYVAKAPQNYMDEFKTSTPRRKNDLQDQNETEDEICEAEKARSSSKGRDKSSSRNKHRHSNSNGSNQNGGIAISANKFLSSSEFDAQKLPIARSKSYQISNQVPHGYHPNSRAQAAYPSMTYRVPEEEDGHYEGDAPPLPYAVNSTQGKVSQVDSLSKPPLRKYHSNPYHVFTNDLNHMTSDCSSSSSSEEAEASGNNSRHRRRSKKHHHSSSAHLQSGGERGSTSGGAGGEKSAHHHRRNHRTDDSGMKQRRQR